MTSDEVRASFLTFFQQRGHVFMPSSSLLPLDDPTVLLTPAGMHQMKPFFLGKAKPPAVRLTSCQKCFRTTDIETVGNERNLTFFEMLGNFSVGDYFKEGAIDLAWELLTEGYALDPSDLHVTVHPTDEEAPRLWLRHVPAERIHRDDTNWWAIKGSAGPCGPDSEIYFDRGPRQGCRRPECAPGCDCDRYLEIWNLVFMQFLQNEKDEVQAPLQQTNIDTGAGLERLAMVLQGKPTVYETDLFRPILGSLEEMTRQPYGKDAKRDFGMRVLCDHGRSMTFLTADGLEPSNEGRGYILRRIIRRAIRYGRLMGLDRPFLKELAGTVIERMSDAYPELNSRRNVVLDVLGSEEEKFSQTLSQGLLVLNGLLGSLGSGATFPGVEAFRLYDTYGFPLEVTKEILSERGIAVDETGFLQELEAQRERSRGAVKGAIGTGTPADVYRTVRESVGATRFLGYETTEAEGTVLAILIDGQRREEVTGGEAVEVVLDASPFYGTGGGQVGDTGILSSSEGAFEVQVTTKPLTDLIVHQGRVTSGKLAIGTKVRAVVNDSLRGDTARNHTGTHVLHAALRQVLGEQATQAGSVVEPDRLRFDFHYSAPLTEQQIREIERIANEQIRRNQLVDTKLMSLDEATKDGAIGLFEEKYGDTVRVVSIPGFSKELCGGTHCHATGEIGELVVVGQESVGSGVRRIEALTGRKAAEYVRDRLDTLRAITQLLPVPEGTLPDHIQKLLDELNRKEKQIERLKREGAGADSERLVAQIRSRDGDTQVLAEAVSADNRDDLLMLMDRLRGLRFSGVVILGAVVDGKPAYVTHVTKDLVGRGINAGPIVREASIAAGGSGGGGRPDLAQGGGRDPEKLAAGLEAASRVAHEQLANASS